MPNNPLLENHKLPPFCKIEAAHIVPALESILAENRAKIAELSKIELPTWDNFAAPLEALNTRLSKMWSPISHLHSVADNEALREAYNACLPLLSAYSSELGQNKALCNAYKKLAASPEYETLSAAQRKTIDNELRDFHLSGVDLPPEQQVRVKDINARLSQLGTTFAENLLDATAKSWKKHITDENQLAGLPDSTKNLARQNAEKENLEGWLLTLDAPCYLPVTQYADDRALRQEIYTAFNTRASFAPWDNSELMPEILTLRKELAQILGFETYADYSLATKMAESPSQVLDFLHDLAARTKPVAQQEIEELKAFAVEQHGISELEMWDVPYYSEKLRHHQYALSQEALRPYFPFPQVLSGFFQVLQRLYGLRIEKASSGVDVWHEDVEFYTIYDEQNAVRGHFYLDPYARNSKRGGAWMGHGTERTRDTDGLQLPVAYINCNFAPPSKEHPSLLTHRDVQTLFHEFGHGLHHMLTQIDFPSVAGISGVAWDAVELPSQLMENWCWEREALDLFARHYETGEPLPNDLFEKMQAAKNFQAGLFMLRQLEFALFDFRLHIEFDANKTNIQTLLNQVREAVAVLQPPEFVRFQHTFQHIFAGGYAAGYYSYKWAEVLSADVFSKFEEHGIFDRDTGREFMQTVLEQGGSREPMELFVEFRGREPKIDALLRHCGLQVTA